MLDLAAAPGVAQTLPGVDGTGTISPPAEGAAPVLTPALAAHEVKLVGPPVMETTAAELAAAAVRGVRPRAMEFIFMGPALSSAASALEAIMPAAREEIHQWIM